jgi:hypothetical protein
MLARTPLCCWDESFTRRAARRVVPEGAEGDWNSPELLQQHLQALKGEDFQAVLNSMESDFDHGHTMHNELDHALLRATLKRLRRGPRQPKVGLVFARHYARKLSNALARHRLRLGAKPEEACPRRSTPSRLVSRAVRVLRQALSPKRRRRSIKPGVAHGLLTPFLNEKRRMHKSQHGSVTKEEAARLRLIWKREFDEISTGDKEHMARSLDQKRRFAKDVDFLRQAGTKRRRLPTGMFLEKEAAPTEPLGSSPSSHSLFDLGGRFPVTASTVRRHVLGRGSSYLAAVADIAAGKAPKPSIGHLTTTADTAFDTRAVSEWAVARATCKEKHPGLCRVRDASCYGAALALARQLSTFLMNVGSRLEVVPGQTLLRLSAVYEESGAIVNEHHHLWLASRCKKPRREVYLLTAVVGESELEEVDAPEYEVRYPANLRVDEECGILQLRTGFAIARHICKRETLVSVRAALVEYKDTQDIAVVQAMSTCEEVDIDIGVGAKAAKIPLKASDAFAAALDAVVQADRSQPCAHVLMVSLVRVAPKRLR